MCCLYGQETELSAALQAVQVQLAEAQSQKQQVNQVAEERRQALLDLQAVMQSLEEEKRRSESQVSAFKQQVEEQQQEFARRAESSATVIANLESRLEKVSTESEETTRLLRTQVSDTLSNFTLSLCSYVSFIDSDWNLHS